MITYKTIINVCSKLNCPTHYPGRYLKGFIYVGTYRIQKNKAVQSYYPYRYICDCKNISDLLFICNLVKIESSYALLDKTAT